MNHPEPVIASDPAPDPAPTIALDAVAGSSNIAAIGYDAQSKTLAVRFTYGLTYHFRDVPPDVYALFRDAPSKGSFFAWHIKADYVGVRIHVDHKTPPPAAAQRGMP
jgi:hypothetical protein